MANMTERKLEDFQVASAWAALRASKSIQSRIKTSPLNSIQSRSISTRSREVAMTASDGAHRPHQERITI